MKILVTGGGGFIGHHVVRRLESLGHEVAILDNLTNHNGIINRTLLDRLHEERLDGIKAHMYKSDISHTIARTHVSIFKPEVIIHLASAPNSKIVNADPEAASQSMVIGLENMLLAAGRQDVKRFIFISSSMVYGNFTRPSMTEGSPKSPLNLYGTLKLAGEHMTRLYAERYGFEYVIIRPSSVYGPRDTLDRVVARFLRQASATEPLIVRGEFEKLDFTYVDDLALGITQVLDVNLNIWEPVFNMTRGVEHSILNAARIIQETVGSRSRIEVHPHDPSLGERGALDISRAKKAFGYNPKTNLKEGIAKYYEWTRQFYSV